jgi:anti-sigma-K factor RskA
MSPPSPTLPERLATVETEVRHLRADVVELKGDVKGMAQATDTRLKSIEETLAQAKGGWRALTAAGAVGGAIVGAVGGAFLKAMGKI